MASDDLAAGTHDEPSGGALSMPPPANAPKQLGKVASILLVVSAVLQIVAVSLPWEHLDITSEHRALDLGVTTFISYVPFNEILYAYRISPHPALAAIFWDVFWRGALVFIGLLLVLAFRSVRRPAIRWTFVVLYGLWLLYTMVLALSFVTTVHAIDTGTYYFSLARAAWWEQYVRVIVTQAGVSGNPISPAWGFWMYVGALAGCWLALGLTIAVLVRDTSTPMESAEPRQVRGPLLAPVLLTIGAVVWITSLAALPMVVADCGKPLVPLTASEVPLLCEEDARVYPLQVSIYGLIVDPALPPPRSLAEISKPGYVILSLLSNFRDFALPLLAIITAPLALVAVWRTRAARGAALSLSVWALLVLAATGFLLQAMADLYFSNPQPIARPVFAEGIGPAAVLMPLGVALILGGVALYWRETLRHDPGAALAVGAVSPAS